MANETSKATRRRWLEEAKTGFPWKAIFTGVGLDVGAGSDPLPFEGCRSWDQGDGDANHLSQYFSPETFDYIHGSQVLEHLHDPVAVVKDWLTLLKKGGHLIITVPDLGLYENFTYPSRHNPDHKVSFSSVYESSPFPTHVFFPDFMPNFKDTAEVILIRLVVRNFDWHKPRDVDQTWLESDQVETWWEFVLKKV